MFLGIDIGTSAVKALLVDDEENGLATATVAVATSRPHALWSEQDPDDWWRATTDAVAQLRAQAGPAWSAVRAIGLSGQMHGAVLLGATGRPLRPAIIWNDGRSHGEASRLNADLAEIGTIAGVIPMPGFTAPKLIWLRQHEPEILRDTAHLLLPKDYVRLQMTGTLATDMSDAAGSLLLDCGARDWSDAILAHCGVSRRQLPDLLEGSAPSGCLRDALASAWGLPKGIVVAAGAGDAAAGAIGVGAIAEGDAFISLGTSAQYFIARDGYHPAPRASDPYLLPRLAAALVPDGGDPERGQQPGLGGWGNRRRRDRNAALRGGAAFRPPVTGPVPALPHRRADAAQ